MDISVLFATFKRPKILAKSLDGYLSIAEGSFTWELIVIDNADNPETREVIQQYEKRLNLRYLVEKKPGKNNAINKGLDFAGGKLIVFTDDDVIPSENWLGEIQAGATRWPNNILFGGKILPHYPVEHLPSFIDPNEGFFQSAYCIADWPLPEGPYNPRKVWGANMAIRGSVFDGGVKFNPSVGPSGTQYIMGSEIELVRRLVAMGQEPVYLPKASVYHQIRENQLEKKWLYGRAFRYGRGRAYEFRHDNATQLMGAPRYMYRQACTTYIKHLLLFLRGNRNGSLRAKFDYWQLRGQIYQYQKGFPEE